MSDYTTDELLKELRECSNGRPCKECKFIRICIGHSESFRGMIADSLESQQKEIDCLERRLQHLLQSDFIESFDTKNYATKEYTRDIQEADKIVRDMTDLEQRMKEIYSADQYEKDVARYINKNHTDDIILRVSFIQNWAKSHPESPKATNGDKFKEVFGRSYEINGFKDDPWWKYEYVQPSDK